jgi:hypothetical protein
MGGFLGFHLQHRREEQDGFPQVFHGEERQHVGEGQGHDQVHPPEGRQDEQWLSGTAVLLKGQFFSFGIRQILKTLERLK